MKVVIIGGGISGLCSAYWLSGNGYEIELLEKNPSAGGKILTDKESKYIIEHGPNSTLEITPLINELLSGLGIEHRKVFASEFAKKRYILKNGKLLPLPTGPGAFISSGLFSVGAKMRLLKEPFINSKSDVNETIAEFTERRLGKEFLDYAIDPFVAGVFAGEAEKLNVKTGFPKLFELEQQYGSLIKGAIKGRKKRNKDANKSKQSAKMFSFKNGMGELINALKVKLEP